MVLPKSYALSKLFIVTSCKVFKNLFGILQLTNCDKMLPGCLPGLGFTELDPTRPGTATRPGNPAYLAYPSHTLARSWDWYSILLYPGTMLIMHPGTFHSVPMLQDCIALGGHFFSAPIIKYLLYSLFHTFVGSHTITNISMDDEQQMLLHIILFWHKTMCEGSSVYLDKIEQLGKETIAHIPNVLIFKDFLNLAMLLNYAELNFELGLDPPVHDGYSDKERLKELLLKLLLGQAHTLWDSVKHREELGVYRATISKGEKEKEITAHQVLSAIKGNLSNFPGFTMWEDEPAPMFIVFSHIIATLEVQKQNAKITNCKLIKVSNGWLLFFPVTVTPAPGTCSCVTHETRELLVVIIQVSLVPSGILLNVS
ncbi:hypothetical protein BT96DRAFT_948906 [Gymnopus androsaceus JB14]|uniref:JmjC domain-containing protein n=1 Tax=Gymnopus androsaceus JB14 TaxID=1447944 RepID=A0A6A4GN95_9AGAR|nr:hypothetical protein BT96DRAFT_948906 [Gymnopus androsaceus JB14]